MNVDEEWGRKGATLSDKTARKEYGLTQDEIHAAIDAGQLQYRLGSIHGNPWLRLLRREVEDLMNGTLNDRQHRQRRAKAELARVDKELKQLRAQLAELQERRAVLLAEWVNDDSSALAPTAEPLGAGNNPSEAFPLPGHALERLVTPPPGHQRAAPVGPVLQHGRRCLRQTRQARCTIRTERFGRIGSPAAVSISPDRARTGCRRWALTRQQMTHRTRAAGVRNDGENNQEPRPLSPGRWRSLPARSDGRVRVSYWTRSWS